MARQSELNAALDLDKGERQVAPPADGEAEGGNNQTAATRQRVPRASRNGARDVSYRARRQRYAGDGPEEEDDAETENVRNREERPSRACERTVIQKV